MKGTVKISVKNLVEFVMRGGSIDNRFSGTERAQEGARIHRMLQKAGGKEYKAEVFLSMNTEYEGVNYQIDGRADGIISENTAITVDEIKTVTIPLEQITENFNQVHWAQAMCYGFIYCKQNELEHLCVRLTYYNMESGQIKRFVREQTIEQLTKFYISVLEKYKKWADFEIEWNVIKRQSAKNLKFPFDSYRKGQREMAAGVYRTIVEKQRLFCQAPTGIGKTVSTIFPAIKAVGENMGEKLFYLTAKTTTRRIAENAITIMRGRELRTKAITLTAKDKSCPLEKRKCNPEWCKYANGHFDRVNDCIFDMINNLDDMTRDVISEYAEKYTVCPHELALDLTYWCDCIICDYNHVFDPTAKLKRFFDDGGDYILLVDEAHNLVDRAREMFSASLVKSDVLLLRQSFEKNDRQYKILTKINTALREMGKTAEGNGNTIISQEVPIDLIDDVSSFIFSCEEWLQTEQDDEKIQAYFNLNNFVKISEFYDARYVTFAESAARDVEIRLYCVDPSELLSQCMDISRAVVLFSATLAPVDYFVSILGGGEMSKQLVLESPFDPDNLCLCVANRISTRYKDRATSLMPVSDMIYDTVTAKKGNYLVFFPSYVYMREIYEQFCRDYPTINTLLQDNGMTEEERGDFLSKFDAKNTDGLVGFCVLGGVFSEGIDLEGDRLIGSVIVGVGLPQLNPKQDIIMSYYNEENGMGFEYAYRYPGMNKVLQAAGRVIRGDNDKGVVLLIDDRFTTSDYLDLFPYHWRDYRRIGDSNTLQKILDEFWRLYSI